MGKTKARRPANAGSGEPPPTLPQELVVHVARQAPRPQVIARMSRTCKGWAAALHSPEGDFLWKSMALEKFPRVRVMLEALEIKSFKTFYRQQRLADRPRLVKKPKLPALDEYVFSVQIFSDAAACEPFSFASTMKYQRNVRGLCTAVLPTSETTANVTWFRPFVDAQRSAHEAPGANEAPLDKATEAAACYLELLSALRMTIHVTRSSDNSTLRLADGLRFTGESGWIGHTKYSTGIMSDSDAVALLSSHSDAGKAALTPPSFLTSSLGVQLWENMQDWTPRGYKKPAAGEDTVVVILNFAYNNFKHPDTPDPNDPEWDEANNLAYMDYMDQKAIVEWLGRCAPWPKV